MTALPTRIAFVREEFRTTVVTDATAKTQYGDQARDTKDEPIETFFDTVSDAAVMAAERLNLLKSGRRRFRHECADGLEAVEPLDFSQVSPTARVIDTERAADRNCAITGLLFDLGADRATFLTWG